jgi:starvation-inducible DNA-binding protein
MSSLPLWRTEGLLAGLKRGSGGLVVQARSRKSQSPDCIAVHELFNKDADAVEDYSDTLADRAAALGGTTQGAVQVAAERSFLMPYALGIADGKEHITTLSISLTTFGESARKAIGEAAGYDDANTVDLLTEISRGVDHQLWFVESHVAPKGFSTR